MRILAAFALVIAGVAGVVTAQKAQIYKKDSQHPKATEQAKTPRLSPEELEEKQADLDEQAAERDQKFAERDQEFAERDQERAERDQEFAERDQEMAERDQKFAERDQEFAERDQQFAERDQEFAERDQEAAERAQELMEEDADEEASAPTVSAKPASHVSSKPSPEKARVQKQEKPK